MNVVPKLTWNHEFLTLKLTEGISMGSNDKTGIRIKFIYYGMNQESW